VSHNGSGDAGMGVERRKGRLYLYARVRAGGQRRTAYLGPLTPAAALAFRRRRAAERRGADEARAAGAAAVREATAVLARGGEFDRLADRVFRAEMALGGFRLHKRSTCRRHRSHRSLPVGWSWSQRRADCPPARTVYSLRNRRASRRNRLSWQVIRPFARSGVKFDHNLFRS